MEVCWRKNGSRVAKDLEVAVNKRIEIAMKKVENLEAAALKEVREQAVEDAMSIVYNKIDDKLDAKLSDGLVDASVNNIKKLA